MFSRCMRRIKRTGYSFWTVYANGLSWHSISWYYPFNRATSQLEGELFAWFQIGIQRVARTFPLWGWFYYAKWKHFKGIVSWNKMEFRWFCCIAGNFLCIRWGIKNFKIFFSILKFKKYGVGRFVHRRERVNDQ
jgi:hypothetical protein